MSMVYLFLLAILKPCPAPREKSDVGMHIFMVCVCVQLRPLGWTSGDAAGLPIWSGLIKFDEVINQGVIKHALRFTGPNSR